MIKKIFNLAKKTNAALNITSNVDKLLDVKLKSNFFLQLAMTSSEPLISSSIVGDNELIVSFTTYSKRIHDAHLVIESIGQQTIKPNRLILWLDEEEFTLDSIPILLRKQIARGLEVRFCPNYRSYKKLVPTLQLCPDADIITIDDDVLYPHDMIEGLVREVESNKRCVIAHRVHRILLSKDGLVLPYMNWEHEITDTHKSMNHVAIGVGGVFYPRGVLNTECLNSDLFLTLAPNADDIWFKVMSVLTRTATKKVDDDRCFWSRFLLIESSQDIALNIKNCTENGNDLQIQQVFHQYDVADYLEKSTADE